MRALLVLACASLAIAGCALPIPEDYFACSNATQCPTGWYCNSGHCASHPESTDASVDGGATDGGRDASIDAPRADAFGEDALAVDAWSATDTGHDAFTAPGEDAALDTGGTDTHDAGSDAAVVVDAGSDAGHDGGNDAGHDASTWTPSGTYSDTGIFYTCDVYDYNVLSWVFVDNGTTLTVTDPTGDIGCMLSGTSARGGTFDVSCTILDDCTATYRFTGMFTGDNTWTATFTSSYSGAGSTCGMFPSQCTGRTSSGIVGTRPG